MGFRTIRRSLAAFAIFLATAHASGADLPQPARDFINAQCSDCHDADSKKGGLDLSSLPTRLDDPALEAKWTYVFDRVRRGEMPPPKKASPPAAERTSFLNSLGGFLSDHDAARQAVNGRVVLRRLNRAEYENTLHDLLAIDTPLADLLPEDGAAFGFDNVSEALRLSATQIESYLNAADKALDAAIDYRPDPRMKRRLSYLDVPDVRDLLDRPHGSVSSDGTKYQRLFRELPDAFVFFENETFGPTLLRDSHVPVAGRYKIRLSVSAFQSTGHPVTVARLMGTNFVLNRFLASFDLSPGQSRIAEVTARMAENEMVYLSANGLDGVSPDGTDLHKVGADRFNGPGVAVHWVEIEGPLQDSWPPRSMKCVFGDVPIKKMAKPSEDRAYELAPANPMQDAARVINAFAARAFRRPVSDQEVERYSGLATEALGRGATFEQAIRRAYKAILTSPEFLFLHEERGTLDDYALAARLSYFLWSTTPDDELNRLAAQGKLKDPATLRAQTGRLLNDPKAHAFTKNFCGQWLNLRAIDATTPDHDLYPEYDEYLKYAMVEETEAFFEEMLRSDLGPATLIDSDFAMLNRRMAEHYNIAGVVGEGFGKAPLPAGSHRGGILTQASILKLTANGTLSSPVIRGNWVMKRILGRPMQPPPADAGSIEPDTRGATTIREQLAKHRRSATCAACHQYMDPPGFALESYDVIGGWRDWYRTPATGQSVPIVDRTTGRKNWFHQGKPVDPSGDLPDGRKFANIEELKKLLLDQQEEIARNLTNNLMAYATGAGVTFADRAEVDGILQRAKSHSYGLRTLVNEVVQSRLFQTK